MAITTAMCNTFKTELLGGTHDLDTDSIKLALIKAFIKGMLRVACPKPQFNGATRIFFYKSKPISFLKFNLSKCIFSIF